MDIGDVKLVIFAPLIAPETTRLSTVCGELVVGKNLSLLYIIKLTRSASLVLFAEESVSALHAQIQVDRQPAWLQNMHSSRTVIACEK